MSRHLGVLLVFGSLAALVGAQTPTNPQEQANLFSRDRELVRAAIDNSLELTGQSGYLDRARTCNNLVKVWAREVESAAKSKDSARANEMGDLLGRVVESGVAKNLGKAREQIQIGSPMEIELYRRRDEAVEVLRPLEELLRSSGRDLEALATSLGKGRHSVESAAEIAQSAAK
jgi:hypothetical protein